MKKIRVYDKINKKFMTTIAVQYSKKDNGNKIIHVLGSYGLGDDEILHSFITHELAKDNNWEFNKQTTFGKNKSDIIYRHLNEVQVFLGEERIF